MGSRGHKRVTPSASPLIDVSSSSRSPASSTSLAQAAPATAANLIGFLTPAATNLFTALSPPTDSMALRSSPAKQLRRRPFHLRSAACHPPPAPVQQPTLDLL